MLLRSFCLTKKPQRMRNLLMFHCWEIKGERGNLGAKDKKYTKAIKRQHKELESAIRRNITSVNTTVNPEALSNGDGVNDTDDGKDMDYQVDSISKSHKWKPDSFQSHYQEKF